MAKLRQNRSLQLLSNMFKRPGKRAFYLVTVVLVPLLLLGTLEISCFFVFRNPQLAPRGIALQILRGLYLNNRDIIQYNQNCSQYDPVLGYTLKPGVCAFSNAEFSITVRVNRLGLRDDNRSLRNPEVLLLGDSHAMGWGVEQEAIFASLVERQTESRLLNAAVSSYGTAREILISRRLDISNLQLLIVQYCPNDFAENKAFVENGYKLATMTEKEYGNTVDAVSFSRRYYPGKYIARTIKIQLFQRMRRFFAKSSVLSEPVGPYPEAVDSLVEARYFLDILLAERGALVDVPILLFEIGTFEVVDSHFIGSVRQLLQDPKYHYSELNIRTIDFNGSLGSKHFYTLDDHLNEEGHRAVAERIMAEIGDMGV